MLDSKWPPWEHVTEKLVQTVTGERSSDCREILCNMYCVGDEDEPYCFWARSDKSWPTGGHFAENVNFLESLRFCSRAVFRNFDISKIERNGDDFMAEIVTNSILQAYWVR